MKIGIVGTGSMGATHAAGWAETGATLGGFVSRVAAKGQPLAEQYGVQVYPDFETMLADVDVVDICTPTDLHHPMALNAAAAGKDIVCEKPLARTLSQGQEMIAACKSAEVRLLVAQVVRFFPEYARAKATVDRGDIGRPAVLRLTRGSSGPRKAANNWFTDFERSGGMLLDFMIHDFDYARWIAGEVESVFAKNIASAWPDAGIDYGLVILKHRSGAISHVEGVSAYPPPMFRTRFEIAGSDGWLEFDSDKTTSIGLHLHRQDNEMAAVPLPRSPLIESPFATQAKSFYKTLVTGAPVRVSAADGLAALQIALAAVESVQQGTPIRLQELPEVTALATERSS